MKIAIVTIEEIETFGLLMQRSRLSKSHVIVDDLEQAELIIVTGHTGRSPDLILENKIYQQFGHKCAVYDEYDLFVPLLPGVYCNAEISLDSKVGRVFSYAHLSRNGVYPNPHIGYRANCEKRYFFSFQGGSTSLVRKRLFNLPVNREDCLIENTSSYLHWAPAAVDQDDRQRRYADTICASEFVLCPRGSGPSSIRLFEVMASGVAPVLIADSYLLPAGVPWDDFLIRIKEGEIEKIPQILEEQRHTSAQRGALAYEAYQAHFAEAVEFDEVAGMCRRSLKHSGPGEWFFRLRQRPILYQVAFRRNARALAKSAVLRAMKMLKIKNPYEMNSRD